MMKKVTILIVDDSITARMKTENLVKQGSYNAIEAVDGIDAYNKIKTQKPDCVLLDLLMPELDGIDLLKKLKDEGNTIPIIIITSDVQEETRKECIEHGAFEIINKPTDSNILLNLIDKALKFSKTTTLDISEIQMDALKEIINIGVGKSSGVLSKLINKRIRLQVPYIKLLTYSELKDEFKKELKSFNGNILSAVKMTFKGILSGLVELVFPRESAIQFVELLSDKESFTEDMNLLFSTTLKEVGNIVLNSLMGTITNLLGIRLRFTLPKYIEDIPEKLVEINDYENLFIILIKAQFTIKDTDIYGDFIIAMEVYSLKELINMIQNYIEK